MKRFTKIFLITAAVLGGLGVLGIGIGLMLGGFPWQPARFEHQKYETETYGEKKQDEKKQKGQTSGGPYGTEIQTLELDIRYGDVRIAAADGDSISVQAENPGKYFKETVEDGDTLVLLDERPAREKELVLTVLLPERMLKEISIDLGAGVLSAERLEAQDISMDLGAGQGNVNRVIAGDDAELSVGAGELQVAYFRGNALDVDCGTGRLILCAEGTEADYNYTLECGIGAVQIGERDYSGIGHEESVDHGAAKDIDVECGIGEVTVTFTGTHGEHKTQTESHKQEL